MRSAGIPTTAAACDREHLDTEIARLERELKPESTERPIRRGKFTRIPAQFTGIPTLTPSLILN